MQNVFVYDIILHMSCALLVRDLTCTCMYRCSNSVSLFSKEDNSDIPAHVLSMPDTCTSHILNQISLFGLYTILS